MRINNHNLYRIITHRINIAPDKSYVATLSKRGIARVAQKVGEEAIELIIEIMRGNNNKKRVIEESADLLFHYWVLLANYKVNPNEIFEELEKRHTKKQRTIK